MRKRKRALTIATTTSVADWYRSKLHVINFTWKDFPLKNVNDSGVHVNSFNALTCRTQMTVVFAIAVYSKSYTRLFYRPSIQQIHLFFILSCGVFSSFCCFSSGFSGRFDGDSFWLFLRSSKQNRAQQWRHHRRVCEH